MAEKFYTILTNIGKAKIANSGVMGSKVNFIKFKIGDSGGNYYEPTEDQRDLVHTVYEGNITDIEIDAENSNWMKINLMIPANVGGFTIREYGVFDEDGNMLAIAKCAESYKPIAEDGSTKELILRMILAVSNTKNINLELDPTLVFVTKEELDGFKNSITTQLSDMVQDRIYYCGTTSGTNTYTAVNSKITSYTEGLTVRVKIGIASTGASTLNINGLGAKSILDSLGNAITSGGLKAGLPYQLCYNGTNFIVLGKGGGGTADPTKVLAPYTFTSDSGQGTGNIPSKSAQTYNPSTSAQTIAAGQYLSGTQTIAAVGGNANVSQVLSGYTFSSANGINLTGQATIESLGGKKFATNTVTSTMGSYQNFTYSDGSNTNSMQYVVVSGLSFTPSLIVLESTNSSGINKYTTVYSSAIPNSIRAASFNARNNSDTTTYSLALTSPAYVNSTGFCLPITANGTYTWYAIG